MDSTRNRAMVHAQFLRAAVVTIRASVDVPFDQTGEQRLLWLREAARRRNNALESIEAVAGQLEEVVRGGVPV